MSNSERAQVSESASEEQTIEVVFVHRHRGLFITDEGYYGTFHQYLDDEGDDTDDRDEAAVGVGQLEEGPLKGKWVFIQFDDYEAGKVTLQ